MISEQQRAVIGMVLAAIVVSAVNGAVLSVLTDGHPFAAATAGVAGVAIGWYSMKKSREHANGDE